MTETEEAQHEDHHPLPVLPKELGDASIFIATGVMEAVFTPLLLAGNGGSPLATDIAHLQRAQQHRLRGVLRAPRAFARVVGIQPLLGNILQIQLVDCSFCLCWSLYEAPATCVSFNSLKHWNFLPKEQADFPQIHSGTLHMPLSGLYLPGCLFHYPLDILREDVVHFTASCLV